LKRRKAAPAVLFTLREKTPERRSPLTGARILHNSHHPYFRHPFGAVTLNSSIRLRLVLETVEQPQSVNLHFYADGEEVSAIPLKASQQEGDLWEYTARLEAPPTPGLIWYYFSLEDRGRKIYYGNVSEQGGPGGITLSPPPPYQITVYRLDTNIPSWYRHSVIYQIFVDRFYRPSDNPFYWQAHRGSLLHLAWDDDPFYIRDPQTGQVIYWDFFGGNLEGVRQKLGYLKRLGVSVIYLNPIFASPSNHKYDTADYQHIDPMFGNNRLFETLCREAQNLGIRIILDGVFSHTGSDSIYFNREGRYPSKGAWQSPESPYYAWYRFNNYPHDYDSWWGIDTMPEVDELEPTYLDFIINNPDGVLASWTNRGANGWRLDVADELPDEFIRRFRRRLKELDPQAVLIGEVWEDASNKISYGERRKYLAGDELDSVMNYPFRQIALDFALGSKTAGEVNRAFLSLEENYPPPNFYALMNLLSSHDVPRLLTALAEAQQKSDPGLWLPDENGTSDIQMALARKRYKLLTVLQMTFPGVPSVYYGDEAGQTGGDDPLNRKTYPWGKEDRELFHWTQDLIALRKEYPVLETGYWQPFFAGDDVYGYLRLIRGGRDRFGEEQEDNLAVILLNRSPSSFVDLSLTFRAPASEQPSLEDLLTASASGSKNLPLADAEIPAELYDVLEAKTVEVRQGSFKLSLEPLAGKVLVKKRWPSTAQRASGILLSLTSLPSPYGIGDLGPEAYAFVDFLAQSRQTYWQILPFNPPNGTNSPYDCNSAFAGNEWLISPDLLQQDGLLTAEETAEFRESLKPGNGRETASRAWAKAGEIKGDLLAVAFRRFQQKPELWPEFEDFIARQMDWLEDYALYRALKDHFQNLPWYRWNRLLARRNPEALRHFQRFLKYRITYYQFLQWQFFRQWQRLKSYAAGRGIKIIGDLPVFVAHDSCDVWVNQTLFKLDNFLMPEKVAGVPPDFFSTTGQRWGNPIYRWDKMKANDYLWWRRRLAFLAQQADLIRLDHFRGFAAAWEIPAGAATAAEGAWVEGPGADFFETIESYLGPLPLVAEDLGVITPDVEDLRAKMGYPGMLVLQFEMAPDLEASLKVPVSLRRSVLYTGTHDNDTLVGWYRRENSPNPAEDPQNTAGPYPDNNTIAWHFIELALKSDADTVIIPAQDLLALGNEARMNFPGTTEGNWFWRLPSRALGEKEARRLAELVAASERLPRPGSS